MIDPDTNTWYFTMKTYRDQTGVEKGRANGRCKHLDLLNFRKQG